MKKVFAILLMACLSLIGFNPAHATENSLSVSGFKTMSAQLSSAQKAEIRAYLSANPGATSVSCVGYAGYNYLGQATHKIQALAKARATAVCNYIHARTGATITSTSGIRTSNKHGSIRKTVVTLSGPTGPGYYTYDFVPLDNGSIQHGGAPTGHFLAGTAAASTFADGEDVYNGPSYGYMGTIGGGQAAYFGHWNTAVDDTGTTYYPGDILPALADGVHVTLYAIVSTG